MDSAKWEALVEKFWTGESSLEEEAMLRQYFQTHDVPEHLEATAAYFNTLVQDQKVKISDLAFEKRLQEKLNPKKSTTLRQLWMNSFKVAAGIALLATAAYLIWKEPTLPPLESPAIATLEDDTFDDPKEAFEETKKALMMLSSNIGRGKQPVEKIATFHETETKIKENLSEL
jgi:hypothetical protein